LPKQIADLGVKTAWIEPGRICLKQYFIMVDKEGNI
jgi:hypothetical protein